MPVKPQDQLHQQSKQMITIEVFHALRDFIVNAPAEFSRFIDWDRIRRDGPYLLDFFSLGVLVYAFFYIRDLIKGAGK